jgi:hypothetical protein
MRTYPERAGGDFGADAVAANKGSPNQSSACLFKRGETFATSVGAHRFKFGEEENV